MLRPKDSEGPISGFYRFVSGTQEEFGSCDKVSFEEYWSLLGFYRSNLIPILVDPVGLLPPTISRDERRRTRDPTDAPTTAIKLEASGYALLSICARNSAIDPKRTVPCGSCASIEPSA
jgi:hypothetical protein